MIASALPESPLVAHDCRELPAEAHVHLVCIVRELPTLEILEGQMLPWCGPSASHGVHKAEHVREDSYGSARVRPRPSRMSWLTTEIHLTGQTDLGRRDDEAAATSASMAVAPVTGCNERAGHSNHPAEIATLSIDADSRDILVEGEEGGTTESRLPKRPTARTDLVDAADGISSTDFAAVAHNVQSRVQGPCRLEAMIGSMQLRAVQAPYSVLHPSSEVIGSNQSGLWLVTPHQLRMYEMASLIGSLVGFVGCAWPLLWGSREAPLYWQSVSTSAAGLLGYVGTGICALAGSLVFLHLADATARLRCLCKLVEGASVPAPHLTAAGMTMSTSSSSGSSSDSSGVGVGSSSEGDGRGGGEGGDESDCCSGTHMPCREGAVPNAAHASSEGPASCHVSVASLGRPCFDELLAQTAATYPTARVAGAGPAPMLTALNAAVSARARRFDSSVQDQEPGQRELICLTHSL